MIDAVILIDALFAAAAILSGLSSRNALTALVTGLFIGLIHAGLVALVGAQAGKFEIAELPYLGLGVDYLMNTGYLTFAHARYVVYLAGCALLLLIGTLIANLVRWILCGIVCAIMPRRAAT